MAKNWRVAPIDEFQDTDPLQYAIFQHTFIAHGNPLFLVGDPKQAIYCFRGADIYAYLQAAEDAEHHYTLATNRRSHAQLINGISAFVPAKSAAFRAAPYRLCERGCCARKKPLSAAAHGHSGALD